MSKVAMVFWSGAGNTQAVAEVVAKGARIKGAGVTVLGPSEFGADQVALYDAIMFGCPSMGAEVLEEEESEPMSVSVEGALYGKKIALFSSWGQDDSVWMSDWEVGCNDAGVLMQYAPAICQEASDDVAFAERREFGASLV